MKVSISIVMMDQKTYPMIMWLWSFHIFWHNSFKKSKIKYTYSWFICGFWFLFGLGSQIVTTVRKLEKNLSVFSCANLVLLKFSLSWNILSFFFGHQTWKSTTILTLVHGQMMYCTPTIITRSWFEIALNYKLRILCPKIEEFPFLVHRQIVCNKGQ